MQTVWALLNYLGGVIIAQAPWAVGLAALFSFLSLFQSQACNPGRPWWRSRDLLTDAQYFFIVPIVGQYVRLLLVVVFAALLQSVMSQASVVDILQNGRGPLSSLPFWTQAIIYVLLSDFLLYWIHRLFHNFVLWPFHAVHHSAMDVDWTTSYRAHPVNQLLGSGFVAVTMVALGISPEIMIALVPFDTLSAAFVHANLNWTLGPLKYVLATPVFHRWHHTGVDEGGDSNFAPTFAFWDYAFGTFYMPEGKLPQTYGVDDPLFPTDWAGQMVVPFRQFMARIQQPRKPTPVA